MTTVIERDYITANAPEVIIKHDFSDTSGLHTRIFKP